MTDTETRNPFTNRGFIFGAVIVGILILAGIIIALTAQGGGNESEAPTATTPATTTEPTPTPTSDPSAASICGLEGYDEAGTLESAPAADWMIVGTMAAPQSDLVGPGQTDENSFRSCYAHTVEGALFATANIWAMGTNASLGSAISDRLVVAGPGRDAAMARDASSSSNGLSAQIAGFNTLSYTGNGATIDIAFTLNTGALVSVATELRWVDGDWKVLLTDNGEPSYRPVNLQNLGGYVPWSGVG